MAKPVINTNKCNGCGVCIDACPGEVLALHDGKAAVVNPDACHCCHTCEDLCEQDACSVMDDE
jgi:NAD-dependent dihydropyrimidine dehydrogenase PreA subunit